MYCPLQVSRCATHMLFILFVVIIKKILWRVKLWSSKLYNFLHLSAISSLLRPNFSLCTLQTYTLNVHDIWGSHTSVPEFTILLVCYNWLIITKVMKDHNTSLFSIRQSPLIGLPDVWNKGFCYGKLIYNTYHSFIFFFFFFWMFIGSCIVNVFF